jgi:hypothetical protein
MVGFLAPLVASQVATAEEPPVPEDVAAYFATGLIPRLADLYGTANSTDPDTTFGDTTTVGTIRRLLAWTPGFLAGDKTDTPTELTNTWIAPVTAKSGAILGLAAVWINPGSDKAELADFARGRALVDALGRAPKDTQLIDDTVQQAWFATDGKTLTPLVTGSSGTSGPLTIAEYQKILREKAAATQPPAAPANPGLLISSITLGGVVVLLAIFILLPARKRKKDTAADVPNRPRRNPRGESERAFDRQASTTEARAISLARAAVSAEAGLVSAMAGASVHPAPTLVPVPEPEPVPQPEAAPAAPRPAAKKKSASATKRTAPKQTTTKLAPAKFAGATKPSTERPATAQNPATTKRAAATPSAEKPKAEKPPAEKPKPEKPSVT